MDEYRAHMAEDDFPLVMADLDNFLDVDHLDVDDLVVAQRLIGVLCPHCKTAREIKGYEKNVLNRLNISCPQDQVVYEKRGCGHCNGVGTVGRTAVYSFFAPNDDIREMLGTDCPILDIIKKAKEGGFKTVMENALHFWLQGTASFSEVHSLED